MPINVGIVAFESCEGPTGVVKKGLIKYTLKESTMPLDISAVAFAMCEIASRPHRRHHR